MPLSELAAAHHHPSPVERARTLVSRELSATESLLGTLMQSEIAPIPDVAGHLAFAGGKRFRPLVALLGARAAGYEGTHHVTVAAVGELLHTATLLHDDVIDEGEFRRGRPAARMPFGNGLAVLTGDYCLARSLQAVARTGELRAVASMSDTVTRMAEGEVAQLAIAGDPTVGTQRYYQVIDRKTAALIAWCASVGELVDSAFVGPLDAYGTQIGYAFQIADDVLDLTADVAQTGKARGQDLREGKLTLPVLLACERDPQARACVAALLASGPPADEMALHAALEAVARTGGVREALSIATEHAQKAAAALDPLPDSPAKTALIDLAHYVVRRTA